MNIERIDDPDLISRLGQSGPGRSTGVLHLSEIYGSLMRKIQPKRFDRRDKDGKRAPMDLVKVESGLVFENMLEKSLAEKFATCRIGELISDEGVRMTPDGWNPTELALEEYKCTWMSSRPINFGKDHEGTTPYTDEYGMPTDKFIHWFIQIKGYLKWLEADTCLLRVLHINGNYEHPYAPEFLTHRLAFEQIEIDENWRMLMNYARKEKMIS